MTRQIDDLIEIDGVVRTLRAWPLEDYLEKLKPKIAFPAIGTNCHRGYQAWWRVVDEKLFVLAVMAGSEASEDASGKVRLSLFIEDYFLDVFQGKDEPVFANWVSGEFYTEKRDKTMAEMLTFKKGVLVSRESCEPNDPYADYRQHLSEMFARLDRKGLH